MMFRPFWLSPRQVVVIPVAGPFKAYAAEVAAKLKEAGIFVEVDVSDNTLNKKIRNAQVAQWNFVMGEFILCSGVYKGIGADHIVVGEVEAESLSVNLRNRDDEVQGREETVKLDVAIERMVALKKSRQLVSKFD